MTIEVKSNVGRDLLQSAAVFNSVPKVVWEYVSNALDNPRAGEPVTVMVRIARDEISIDDTGRGMAHADLKRFFEMHGENEARRQGRTVRGRFGTGKSAAFGIASCLTVNTVNDGLENIVALTRQRVQQAKDGQPFPVDERLVDAPTNREPGTRITITEINVSQLEIDRTRKFVERHLRRQHQTHQVFVNQHRCEMAEPPYVRECVFDVPPPLRESLRDSRLVLRVSPAPLDADDAGVAVFSRGVWHETTYGDQGGKQFAEYLFGEVDVPEFDDDDGPVAAFDNTRSNQLNRSNALVVKVLAWISYCIEVVRFELAEEDRKRRSSEVAKRLDEEATKIADLLNEDFQEWAREFARIQATSRAVEAGTSVPSKALEDTSVTALLGGDLQSPERLDTVGIRLPPGGGKETTPLSGRAPRGGDNPGAPDDVGRPRSGNSGGAAQKRRSRTGFSIEFKGISDGANRSRYIQSSRTIIINLDHPLVRAAMASDGGIDGRTFRQLSYEIALTEYAFALGFEIAQKEGESYTPYTALADALNTVNRVSRLLAKATSR